MGAGSVVSMGLEDNMSFTRGGNEMELGHCSQIARKRKVIAKMEGKSKERLVLLVRGGDRMGSSCSDPRVSVDSKRTSFWPSIGI